MFKSYFKTAWRSIIREKGNTLINIAGLTLSITCSTILFLMVQHLSSFDSFHTKRDRIYRVVNKSQGNEGVDFQSGVPSVLPDAFRNDFPEAEKVVFTSYRNSSLITIPQKNSAPKKYLEEAGIVFTEPDFLEIFDRTILTGNAAKALDDPNEAIISSSLARKYFGKEDAIGEVVSFDGVDYKISAIMEDAPDNTDFPFTLMLSYITIKTENEKPGWESIWSNENCYFLIKENEDIKTIESRMSAFSKKYLGEDDHDKTEFILQPLKDLHFDERFDNYTFNTTPRVALIAFGVIAIVLLITACVNFINLATAEAIKRSKEIGIRKSLGSSRGQLITQFLGETSIITIAAVLISIAFTQLGLNILNPFLEMNLKLNFSAGSTMWFYLAGVMVGVALLSGLYPAFVVSGYRPAAVLKNQITNRTASGFGLRRALVVLQFFISQLLIIVTIVIIYQMEYSATKDLGFRKEAILFAPIPEREGDSGISKMRTLRNEMNSVHGVEVASLASAPPSSGYVSETNFSIEGVAGEFATQVKNADGYYLELYKLNLLAGRNIEDLDTASGVLVNEKLLRIAGFHNPEEALGKRITLWNKALPIIGVIKDFHTVSLREPIEATVIFNRSQRYRFLSLKADLDKTQEIIAALKSKWEATYPEHLFEYEFLDQSIKEFYEGERRISGLFAVFSSIAIFIGCLGLYGLASFMSNQKTKEVGVRKVLGASVEGIVFMFSKEYIKLVLIGFAFSAPVAWLITNAFLGEFAYKIEVGPAIFILGLVITLTIALLTVGYKSFRTAILNPVNALRYE